jgi:serine/threonine-protein kinase
MATLEPGAQLGDYRVERLIDTGGMGEVYLASDQRLHRRAALKVLPPALARDASFRSRFERESRIAASLEHPNVLPVYASGETDGLAWIAMRFVDGPTLAALIHRERLGPVAALSILRQVADALDAAHARGLVHRDVKPGNILVEPGEGGEPDRAYLADFGLARDASGDRTPGQRMGTVHYVAPELIEDRPIDGRSDGYSLGCVLFECLTGQVPFPAADARTELMAHLVEPPPSASALVPALPSAVDAVLAQALAKAPGERFDICRALVDAAAAALAVTERLPRPDIAATRPMPAVVAPAAGTPPITPPIEQRPQGAPGPRRRRSRAVALVAVLALLGAGAAAWWLAGDRGVHGPVGLTTSGSTSETVSPSRPTATATATAVPTSPSSSVASPTVDPSAFPDPIEQAVLDDLPSDVHDCVRADQDPDGAMARLACSSGPQSVQYNVFSSPTQAQAELDARVEAFQAPAGDCAEQGLAVGPYTIGDVTYGRLLCYLVDDQAWVEWNYTASSGRAVYAWAWRDDDHGASLYQWWTKHAAVEV